MDHPISTTYLDVQAVKASAALPGAGAYDAPAVLACPGFKTVTLFVEYTRGGAGGKVKLKPEVSPVGTGDVWYALAQFSEPVIAAGADSVALAQREVIEYGATGAAIEKFRLVIDLAGAAERLRVAVCESGAVATPGTCAITAVFS